MADLRYWEDRARDDAGAAVSAWVKLNDNGDGTHSVSMSDRGRPDTKWAIVSASSADNTIVAAVAAKKIRVHQVALQITGSCSIRFESGTGGTALTGVMPIVAGAVTAILSGSNGQFLLPYSPVGWFETAVNTLLNLELSASSAFGVIAYSEVA